MTNTEKIAGSVQELHPVLLQVIESKAEFYFRSPKMTVRKVVAGVRAEVEAVNRKRRSVGQHPFPMPIWPQIHHYLRVHSTLATLYSGGVVIDGQLYYSEDVQPLLSELGAAPVVRVRRHPNNHSKIAIWSGANKAYLELGCGRWGVIDSDIESSAPHQASCRSPEAHERDQRILILEKLRRVRTARVASHQSTVARRRRKPG
jgi:hypothetical protein